MLNNYCICDYTLIWLWLVVGTKKGKRCLQILVGLDQTKQASNSDSSLFVCFVGLQATRTKQRQSRSARQPAVCNRTIDSTPCSSCVKKSASSNWARRATSVGKSDRWKYTRTTQQTFHVSALRGHLWLCFLIITIIIINITKFTHLNSYLYL